MKLIHCKHLKDKNLAVKIFSNLHNALDQSDEIKPKQTMLRKVMRKLSGEETTTEKGDGKSGKFIFKLNSLKTWISRNILLKMYFLLTFC